MKKIFLLSAFIFLLFLLSGCLRTLHPIFTKKDLVYEPQLVGNWKTKNNNTEGLAVITNLSTEKSIELPGNISSIKEKGYLVTYKDVGGDISDRYIAFLAQIGRHRYFDYYPVDKEADKKLDDFYTSHFIKMHTSYRVDMQKNGDFQLSQLDEDYVKKLINEKKIRISHETDTDGNIIITAPTEELQQYLVKYGDDPGAYRNEKTTFSK